MFKDSNKVFYTKNSLNISGTFFSVYFIKKKMKNKKLSKTSISILSTVAIIIVGGFVLKLIADSQSRVDY